MPYKIAERGELFGAQRFLSFWLFHEFSVGAASTVVDVRNMYLAVYFSGSSANADIRRPKWRSDELSSYEIIDTEQGSNKFKVNNASLMESRIVEYSNEFGRIHLFQCTLDLDQQYTPDTWFDAGSWNPPYKNPEKNQSGREPFLAHRVEFDNCKDRHVDGLMVRENFQMTESVTLVLPFLQSSIFASILSNATKAMPTLKLTRKPVSGAETSWTYFDTKPLPGGVQGFSMVTQGAFSTMSFASSEIGSWYGLGHENVSPSEIVDRLASVIQQSTSFRRSLASAGNTLENSRDEATTDNPVEVLHLFNLNENDEVQPVV